MKQFTIILSIIAMIAFSIRLYQERSVVKAKAIYCPSAYKIEQISDGYGAHDTSTPLIRSLIVKTDYQDGYLYDDKGNAWHWRECIGKD